ncbi:MAG: hypothetical protein ACRD1Z_14630, partial [Vicinamibacteria bacterium]
MNYPAKRAPIPRDLLIIYSAAILRAICVGGAGVVLGLHLAEAGLDPARIGAVIGLGLGGGALGTLLAGLLTERLGRRWMLRGVAALTLAGGFLSGALVSYWFFHRFGIDEQTLGPLFFAAHI